MRYIVDVPPELAKKISSLVNEGRYESVSQFANTSFQNQLLLEESPKETLDGLIQTVSKPKLPKTQFSFSNVTINFDPKLIKTVYPPDPTKIPNDCLWGQYNRVFPVKITLRVLVNILKSNETVELQSLHTQAVESAREVGLQLKKEDKKSKRKYGDMLSSALPIGRDIGKTERRFMNHFVGYCTRAGRIEGAPGALKFLTIFVDEDNTQKVGITEAGLKFASLVNPILDNGDFSSTLSKDESSFYITHVFENLLREKELNLLILSAIKSGKSSPTELNEAALSLSRGWSNAMISTIRAGAVSRLNEIGLISRSRHGVEVRHSLTDFGNSILSIKKEPGAS